MNANHVIYPIRHKQIGPDKEIDLKMQFKRKDANAPWRLAILEGTKTKLLWPINIKFDTFNEAQKNALMLLQKMGLYFRYDQQQIIT